MIKKIFFWGMIASIAALLPFNFLYAQNQQVTDASLNIECNVVEQVTPSTIEHNYSSDISVSKSVQNFLSTMGFANFSWQVALMLGISFLLMFLAIVKGFEPLLLLPIAFGMMLTNLPNAEMFHAELYTGGHIDWGNFLNRAGLLDYLYLGVKLGIYPCLIFVGIGAMTDFGPLIANPKSLLLGGAAQLGIFLTFIGAVALGFAPNEAASIGIIGGADGPTAIFLTSKLAPNLLGPIAVAAYSYMALVPVIQPPIMRMLTTQKERTIKMAQMRSVSKLEKVLFPIAITAIVALLLPSATSLIGCLMFGNLLKECGVAERLSKTVQNELMNIVTVFLGTTVGATATAANFLDWWTLKILGLGIIAFGFGTAGGVLLAKLINLFSKNKINPLIGSAGVSAVPMAARVSQTVGQQYDKSNHLLMHAMGPNVAGVIGSAIAAGLLLSLLG
jgi:oxaloacetate decarboxylase beta subunit